MSDMDISKITNGDSIVDFAEEHPLLLIGIIIVLILMIVGYFVYSYVYDGSEKLTSKKKKNKDYLSDNDEIDSLVASIKEKQKKNVGSK